MMHMVLGLGSQGTAAHPQEGERLIQLSRHPQSALEGSLGRQTQMGLERIK